MDNSQWLMHVEGALSAHFIQPDGMSRPGTDWAIGLRRGDSSFKVMVRAYLSDDASQKTRADHEYQGRTVIGYLSDLLDHGWTPSQSGELIICIQNPSANTDRVPIKSWWRFGERRWQRGK